MGLTLLASRDDADFVVLEGHVNHEEKVAARVHAEHRVARFFMAAAVSPHCACNVASKKIAST